MLFFRVLSACYNNFTDGYGAAMLNTMRRAKGVISGSSEFPLILGRDFSGVVVRTGRDVRSLKPGDEVSAGTLQRYLLQTC